MGILKPMRILKTIKEVLNNNNIIPPLEYDFLNIYNSNKELFDIYYINKYGLLVYDDAISKEGNINDIYNVIKACLLLNKENLTHIYNNTLAEYNVLDNVFENSTHTFVFGEKTNNDNFGVRSNSSETQPVNSNTENFVSGYNSEKLVVSDKSVNTTDSISSTNTTQAVNDIHIEGTHTDTETVHREGNIGVTTSAQLLTQDFILWMTYNFYDYLFKLIFDTITIPFYISDEEV